MTFKHAQQAFEQAIYSGRLSDDPESPRYAGRFMYMGTSDGDLFKHIDTRSYLPLVPPADWKPSSKVHDDYVTDHQRLKELLVTGGIVVKFVETADGKRFKVDTKMTDAERQRLWKMYESGDILNRMAAHLARRRKP